MRLKLGTTIGMPILELGRSMLAGCKRSTHLARVYMVRAVKELDIYRNSAANRHPNIVFTHGFKVEHGLVYLIMDRCDCSLSTSAGETSSAFVRKLRVSSDLPRELAKQCGISFQR